MEFVIIWAIVALLGLTILGYTIYLSVLAALRKYHEETHSTHLTS